MHVKLGLPLGSHQTQHISYVIHDEKSLGIFLKNYMYMIVLISPTMTDLPSPRQQETASCVG